MRSWDSLAVNGRNGEDCEGGTLELWGRNVRTLREGQEDCGGGTLWLWGREKRTVREGKEDCEGGTLGQWERDKRTVREGPYDCEDCEGGTSGLLRLWGRDRLATIAIFMIQPHFLASKAFSVEMNVCYQCKTAHEIYWISSQGFLGELDLSCFFFF